MTKPERRGVARQRSCLCHERQDTQHMNPSSQEPSSEAERQQSAHATPLRGSVAELPASRPASCVDAEAGEEHEGDALADLPTCFPRGHYLAPRGFDRMLPTIRFSFDQELLEGPNSAAPTYQAVAPSEERLEDFNKVVDLLKSGEKDSVAAILSSSAETEQSLLDPSGPMLMLAIDERLPTLAMAILELMPSHCNMLTDANGQNALHALAPACWSVRVVQAVLDAMPGEGLTQRSSLGTLPLHCFFNALSGYSTDAHDCAFEVLRRSPPELLAETDQYGRNLLHFVAGTHLTLEETQHIAHLLPESAFSQRDCNGRTPLHTAARDGSHEMSVRFTDLTPSAVLFMADCQGFCPLELALKRSRLHDFRESDYNSMRLERLIVRTLDDMTAVGNYTWKVSPLHLMWSITPSVLLPTASNLLMASPHAREWALRPDPESGVLLIHVAASRGRVSEALLRLIALCPTDHLATPVPSTGQTVLHLAAGRGRADVVHALLERLPPSAIGQCDHNGVAPLLNAARASSDEVIMMLCDSYTGDCPFTAEEWAQLHVTLSVDACLALIQCCSPNYLESTVQEEWEGGQTPLHAVRRRTAQDPELFRQLVHLCPPWFVTVLNWRGRNAIHEALATNKNLLLEVLLESEEGHIAATMPMGGDGYRPLEIAVRQSNLEAVQLLVGCLTADELLLPTKDGGTLVEFLDRMAVTHKENMLGMVYKMRSLLQPSPKSAFD